MMGKFAKDNAAIAVAAEVGKWSNVITQDAAHIPMYRLSEFCEATVRHVVESFEKHGWKLVPNEPTLKQLHYCESAMRDYIRNMTPADKLAKWGNPDIPRKHGYRFNKREKAQVRYRAMLKSAPSVFGDDGGGENDAEV